MKTKLFIVSTLMLSSVAIFFSCDKVEAPYMIVSDVSDCPVPVFPDITSPEKTLLIEEFTGHKCVYCPTGAHYIHQIKQQTYGSRVVALAIHSGGLSEPEPGNYDLDLRAGTFGEELYAYFGSPAQPRAGFNREKIDGTNVFYGTPATWQTKAEQVLAQSPVMTLQIINNYDSASRKLCAHVKSKFLSANTQSLKIALFISEDSITGYQLNNNNTVGTTPEIENYVFMDVMRDAFAGSFGEVLTNGGVAQDSAVIRTYKKILDPAWNDKHCKVVAYVYDAATDVVLQVAEEKVN